VTLLEDLNRDRARSAAAVAAVHALLGYLLIAGLGVSVADVAREQLKIFDIEEDPPPPPEPMQPEKVKKSAKAKPKDPEGAAAPANIRNTPTEIVVPPPKVILPPPPPIPAAPAAGQGSAPAAGAALVPGPGTGRGGQGTGLGSGAQGNGTGGGGGGIGGGVHARWLSGGIDRDDYPSSAVRSRAQGTVGLRFVVGPDGRISDCAVTRSSGSAVLDATTCRLLKRRLRYRPARDGSGRPIAETIFGDHEWGMDSEPPPIDVEPEEDGPG
jgi:protein TonB